MPAARNVARAERQKFIYALLNKPRLRARKTLLIVLSRYYYAAFYLTIFILLS